MKKILVTVLLLSSTQLFASQLSGNLNIQIGNQNSRYTPSEQRKQRYGNSGGSSNYKSSRYKNSNQAAPRSRFRTMKNNELRRCNRDVRQTRMGLNQKRKLLKQRRNEIRALEKDVQNYQYDLRFYSDKQRCIQNSRNQVGFDNCLRKFR